MDMDMDNTRWRFDRRDFLRTLGALGAVGLLPPRGLQAQTRAAIKRPIPSSGEQIPVIGMGTSGTFRVGANPSERAALAEVLKVFFDNGGALIDSSPMYGPAQEVLGDLLNSNDKKRLFAATKVWTDGKQAGILQMEESRRLWGVQRFDLMQIHNLRDWEEHVETLKDWKAQGKIRYFGITTSHGRDHSELERALNKERFDFVQLTYNVEERAVERRLLPLAADRGTATLINRPFARGSLFRKVRGKSLPDWAGEFDCASWAQFFLKFAVSHPAVTCAIPATSKAKHMKDDMDAGFGRLPDAALRLRMIKYIETL
jgi:diketogulonate reductase-like aldo/keto reductase